MKVTLGEDKQREIRFVGNAPLHDGVLAGKLFVTSQQADGFLSNQTLGGHEPDTDYKNYGVTLLLAPKDGVEAQLTVERFEDNQYDPESTHLDDRLKLNATLFRTDFKDKQEQSIQFDATTQTVATVFDNVADARYQGAELETEYVFTDWFRAFLNYGYLDAEYSDFQTDINASDNQTIIEDASFLKPRNAPENTLGIGGTLSWPMGPGLFEIYGKYSCVDATETNLLNTPLGHLDARKDVTASIGYLAEDWSVVAFGRNLTDERYEIFTPVATLFAVGTLNRPRSYGVELEYRF